MQTTEKDVLVRELEQADREVHDAEERYAEALSNLRAICLHETLSEASWEPSRSGFFAAMQALRICEDCGAEEQGPSFRVLTGRAYPARRDGKEGVYSHRKRGGRYLLTSRVIPSGNGGA